MESSIAPVGYLPRIVDEQVKRYLEIFGAVEISGTKFAKARQHAYANRSFLRF